MSRVGIWKHIKSLQAQGYTIESHPKEGYRLIDIPDILIPEEITPHLETSWLGRAYHHFAEIGSTNDQALIMAIKGAPNGTVIVAERQTLGRGRLRREWLSPPRSGIYMSMLLTTPLPVREAPQSTQVAALALVKTLRNRYGLEAKIKWPNDILIKHRKVAGILTEMQSDQDLVKFFVIGIGINVNQSAEELAGPFRYPATSVALELGGPTRRQELLLSFLYQFETEYDRFLEGGFAAIQPEAERASAILGKTVKIHSGKEEIRGKVLGFTPEGALRLSTEGEEEMVVWVGDVTQVEGTF
jgi:BirA family biotin operon repressor/biotin-[acetyl-CoA-carboxylase] ligase